MGFYMLTCFNFKNILRQAFYKNYKYLLIEIFISCTDALLDMAWEFPICLSNKEKLLNQIDV